MEEVGKTGEEIGMTMVIVDGKVVSQEVILKEESEVSTEPSPLELLKKHQKDKIRR